VDGRGLTAKGAKDAKGGWGNPPSPSGLWRAGDKRRKAKPPQGRRARRNWAARPATGGQASPLRQAQGFGGWRKISHLTKKQWWTAGDWVTPKDRGKLGDWGGIFARHRRASLRFPGAPGSVGMTPLARRARAKKKRRAVGRRDSFVGVPPTAKPRGIGAGGGRQRHALPFGSRLNMTARGARFSVVCGRGGGRGRRGPGGRAWRARARGRHSCSRSPRSPGR